MANEGVIPPPEKRSVVGFVSKLVFQAATGNGKENQTRIVEVEEGEMGSTPRSFVQTISQDAQEWLADPELYPASTALETSTRIFNLDAGSVESEERDTSSGTRVAIKS